MDTPGVTSLNCPKCDAILSIPKGLTFLTCNYCHSKLSLFQSASISSLQLVSEEISGIKEDTDIIAAELTLKRLKKELNILINMQDSLYYMVAFVQVASSNLHWDDHHLDTYMQKFRVLATYTMMNIYYNKPESPNKPFLAYLGEPSSNDIKKKLKSSFSEEDFKSMINKYRNEPDKYVHTKKKLAIEKYISRIEELIEINREIEVKRKQISGVKAKLP